MYWLPALSWLFAVALFSSGFFGASHTGWFLTNLLRLLHIQLTAPSFYFLHYMIRKIAHFGAYGILSWLMFRAMKGSNGGIRNWKLLWAALTLFICLMTSSADEVHQAFTPGRTGTWKDVALDMMGATFAQLVLLLANPRRRTAKS